jgi:hypothetical protein
MATDARKSDFISEAREAARDLWNAQQKFIGLQAEWNGQDYGNTITAEDFSGSNEGLTTANIGAVVFDTANAVQAVMAAGHATNVTNLL